MKMLFRTLVITSAMLMATAAHADKTVTFNIPVKLEKLDPAVKSAFMYCQIFGDSNLNILEPGPLMIITNGGYVGMTAVTLTVKEADLAKVKSWTCFLRFKQNTDPSNGAGVMGPNVPGQPWTNVAAGAVGSVSGTF